MEKLINIIHDTDICVVGGGIAGMLAAISAARHGSKVVLVQDRPVLGGNASSEIRVAIRGARGENMHETGLLEELALETIYRNPTMNYSIWDSILFEKIKYQENIELLLNCSCCDASMENEKIKSIKCWQTTTQQWHTITAKIFADCSGDSILAPLSGAEYRVGRESCDEYNEDIAPEKADKYTMGLTRVFYLRETNEKKNFIAPTWANHYTKDDFPHRLNFGNSIEWLKNGFWWMELGGVNDSIADTEMLHEELQKIVYGIWDFIKNSGHCAADNWDLEWVGALAGKRESRRYIGDHVLTQNDVRAEGRFDDLIAYGGWSMDDHHPMGFNTSEEPTTYHKAPSPYGIPYRSLYSKNINNLMFAGRNISATHTAMSSSRVMSTCAVLGQAMGTAAAIAINNSFSPRDVYKYKITELQDTLMDDDCYLPFHTRKIPDIMKKAEIITDSGDASLLINGLERKIGNTDNQWIGKINSEITIRFNSVVNLSELRIVFDSDINRDTYTKNMSQQKEYPNIGNIYLNQEDCYVPKTLIKEFTILADMGDGVFEEIYTTSNNYQRLFKLKLDGNYSAIKLIPKSTWDSNDARIYSFDVK